MMSTVCNKQQGVRFNGIPTLSCSKQSTELPACNSRSTGMYYLRSEDKVVDQLMRSSSAAPLFFAFAPRGFSHDAFRIISLHVVFKIRIIKRMYYLL